MNPLQAVTLLLVLSLFAAPVLVQRAVPPHDLWNDKLWNDKVPAEIKDRSTLSPTVTNSGFLIFIKYCDVFFTSNSSANYFDAKDRYAEHTGEKITIHGYLAYPTDFTWRQTIYGQCISWV